MLPKTWVHGQRFLLTSRPHHRRCSLGRKHFQSDWKWSKNMAPSTHTNRADRCRRKHTQTRLLDRPITGQITATGDAGRGVCLARLANRNRTECFSVRCYLPIVCNSVGNTEDGLKTPTSVTLGRFSCQSISKSWKACRWLVSKKKANVLIYSFFNRNTKALSGVINLQWKDQPKWGSDSLWRSASTQLPSLWWNVK